MLRRPIVWKLVFMFSILVGSLGFNTASISAANPYNCTNRGRSLFVLNSWDTYLPCSSVTGIYINSLDSAAGLLYWVLDSLFKLTAYITIGFVIWGSIKFIKAQGEPAEIADARKTILNALIGLAICIASVAIVQFVSGVF